MADGTLHREDWARAALDAMAAGGVSAVKVETLAPTLGATKGSFYWHFADRADLIEAAVALWEESETEAIIESLADADDPRDRLRRLFSIIFVHPELGAVDAALIAARDQPAIAEPLRRVTNRRVGFIRDAFAGLGFDAADAERRALYALRAVPRPGCRPANERRRGAGARLRGGVHRSPAGCADRDYGYRLMTTMRGSVISCTANFGPSRVLPESLTPP